MQGRQVLQPSFLMAEDLDGLVPKDHILKRIDRILDLTFLRQLTSDKYTASGAGRPGLDPVVFFKMQIISFLFGIKSDRKLCEDIQVNLAYRWFLRLSLADRVPDHSTLSKTRDRLGEGIYRDVFEKILKDCQKAGLLSGKQIMTDATLIRANAATESMKRCTDLRPKDSGETPKIRCSRKTHSSTTDPDASWVARPGHASKLYYKAHYSIDGASRVVADCHVTTGSVHECTVFESRMTHLIDHLGLQVKESIADKGYGHGPAYQFLSNRKIRAYISLRDGRLGRGKAGPKEGFRYDRKADVYSCPNGEILEPYKPSQHFTRYRVTSGSCKVCPVKASCMAEQGGHQRLRYINRSQYQREFDSIRRRMHTKAFRTKLRQRMHKLEGLFAEAKVNHCLGRARYRGLSKVQTQVYMTAMVQNLKRLLKAGTIGPKEYYFLIRQMRREMFCGVN